MSPFKPVSCLSVVVSVLGALVAAGASAGEDPTRLPGGGFPASEREFMLVNVGFSVCLTVVDGQPEGRPCAWDEALPTQRWRYQDRQLVSMAGGECFLAPTLVPCQFTGFFDVSYDLLTQHLVLTQLESPRAASCHVIDQGFQLDESTGEFVSRYVPNRAALDSSACAVTRTSSRWVILPVSP